MTDRVTSRRPAWSAVSHYFEWDGTYRDLLVPAPAQDVWHAVVTLLSRLGRTSYVDPSGRQRPFPGVETALGADRHSHVLRLEDPDLPLDLVFSDPSTVDLSFDGRNVSDEGSWARLEEIAVELARAADSSVALGYDGGRAEGWPCLVPSDSRDGWAWVHR